MSRRRSLRTLVLVVVVTVALLPVPVVALLRVLGEAREAQTSTAVRAATFDAITMLRRGERPESTARAIAEQHRVTLRIIARDGTVIAQSDHDPHRASYMHVASIPLGETEDVYVFEHTAGPLEQRAIVRSAFAHRPLTECTLGDGGALLVCESASIFAERSLVVHAQRSAMSAAQRLANTQRALWALTAFVLLSGLSLATWLIARIVRPLDALRAALATRSQSAKTATEPVVVDDAPPEVSEVVAAHNRVLRALAEERSAKESLASELVHEIKSPLAAIRLAVEQLEQRVPDRALSQSAHDAIKRVDRTVGMLLELSRAEAGLPTDERAHVALGALVEGACSAVAIPSHIALEVRVDEPVAVRAAAEPLARAIACVVDNARFFARGKITVTVARDGDAAVVRVHDDGEGIASDTLPRVFDRFYSARRESGGTGVGLALVRAVIEAHGGSARVESSAGDGTTFVLSLPRSH